MLTFLSRLFDPLVILSFLTILTARNSITDPEHLLQFLLVFFVLILSPPVVILYSLVRSKKISGWDVSDRKERVGVLTGQLVFLVLDCFLVWYFGNTILFSLYVLFFVWFVGFYAITFRWKISGHVGVLTLALGLLYVWYGSVVLPAFILVPFVAWVRVKRGNHTVMQVIGGMVYSLMLLIFYRIFNF